MKFTYFAFALAAFLCFSCVSALAREHRMEDFSIAIEKIKQQSFPLRTLEFEYDVERRKNGRFFSRDDTCVVRLDFGKNLAYWGFFHPACEKTPHPYEMTNHNFMRNGIITEIFIRKDVKGSKNAVRFHNPRVYIGRSVLPFPFALNTIIEYNAIIGPQGDSVGPTVPFFINGSLPYVKPIFEDIDHNGNPALRITSSETIQKNVTKDVYTFSKKTGSLLKRKTSSGEMIDGKIVENFSNSINYSDFISCGGVLFPLRLQYTCKDGSQEHITIKKETLRINEPIDPSVFIPVIPGGSRVIDDINGIRYITPVVGNPEAMKELEANLNAHFEDADNEKPKTASKPATK